MLETGTHVRDIVSSKVLYKCTELKPASAGWTCISDVTRSGCCDIKGALILQHGQDIEIDRPDITLNTDSLSI